MESDGLGYISTQEHVTPHIGITARLFGFDSADDEEAFASRTLDKPSYRYQRGRFAVNDVFLMPAAIREARLTPATIEAALFGRQAF